MSLDELPENGPASPGASQDLEALFFRLFLRLMDAPAERVAAEIFAAQRDLCRALDLDRSALWQTTPHAPDQLFVTHVYDADRDGRTTAGADGSVERAGTRDFLLSGDSAITWHAEASSRFPWLMRRVLAGETTAITDPGALPPEAAHDAAVLRGFGTLSTVIVPLLADDTVLGCLSFATTRRSCEWTPDLVARFERLAQVFAKALARARAQNLLREREAEAELSAAAAAAGLWQLDLSTGWVSATPTALALYGFDPDAGGVSIEDVIARVHADDRALLRDRMRWAREHEEHYAQDYRLTLPDGRERWIQARGRPFATAAGEPPDCILGASIDITERKEAEARLGAALAELGRLRDRLQNENLYLQHEVARRRGSALIVGTSAPLRRALSLAEQVAPTMSTVLLLGETGTGKERFAATIHDLSPRRQRPMVKVNCAAMPATLIESELFGRERGAYTGALTRQIGRFELAHESTIFLDEIGDLPLETQVKLLRVIDSREFERLGSPTPVRVNVRIIAATNRDLEAAVREGRFREDLFFRLNVFPIVLPPLRERSEDIPLLVREFADELQQAMGRRAGTIPAEDLRALQQYSWPGNIRELRNLIERAMISADGPVLRILPPASPRPPAEGSAGDSVRRGTPKLQDLERDHILAVLQQVGWRIRGASGAAAILGLPPTTLEHRMARLGIHRPGR